MDVEETTVVVEPAAPAGPAYVTAGELDARLALMEERIGVRLDDLSSRTVEAVVTAEDAQVSAEVAGDVASLAVEIAADAAEAAEAAEEVAQEEAAPPVADEPGQPQPPLKREDRSEDAGGEPENEKKHRTGYGSGLIYGNN